MKTFLEHVATDILHKYGNNLSRTAIVFPNKRASLFLNIALAEQSGKPLWSPAYITISDLFRRHSVLEKADDIKLICDLHKSFVTCTGLSESLDKFYGWGQLLLSDFDDIDKNMADAEKVFANLKDIHELDDVAYLSEEQKAVLEKFFSNFSEDHNTQLKEKFIRLWSHFYDIYRSYNARLASQGLAYEGQLYRKVIEQQDLAFEYERYIFVGFNMMQKVEMRLLDILSDKGLAAFYWDFDKYYMDNGIRNNEASVYIRELLKHYPNEFDVHSDEIYNNFSRKKDITFVSAPTENIQARFVSDWLGKKNRSADGRHTAIVMADENLLPTIVHSFPDAGRNGNKAYEVNITSGYPLSLSPFASLVSLLIDMQTIGRKPNDNRYRLHEVSRVLHHPYARFIAPDARADIMNRLAESKLYYPAREDLCLDNDTATLFRNIDSPMPALKNSNRHFDRNSAMCSWITDILRQIGINYRKLTTKDDTPRRSSPFFEESLFRTYTLVNRLRELIDSGDLEVGLSTFKRLLQQIIRATSIPFHGEPAVGIQVMGVLETRNLDFEHVLLLSCNEGKLPKGVDDSSFIPYSIRKAFGLTTIDNKIAIYSYYFHSLLQRASDITIAYNSSTEGGMSGEMSRFMLQMFAESNHAIKRLSLSTGLMPIKKKRSPIEKDEHVMSVLTRLQTISPTAVNNYLRCQLRFYYRYVAHILEPNETDGDIDNRMFGNIFHRSAELVYVRMAGEKQRTTDENGMEHLSGSLTVDATMLSKVLENKILLRDIVDQAFREEFFHIGADRRLPGYNGLQLINHEVITDYLKRLLKCDLQIAPFTILGLEKKVETVLSVDNVETGKVTIGGIIDRLDKTHGADGRLRVIDYKTGRAPSSKVLDVEEIFSTTASPDKHTDYYLQTCLYSLIVRNDKTINRGEIAVSPALLFIREAGGKDYDPVLELNKTKIYDVEKMRDEFKERLANVIAEIFNFDLPFMPAADRKKCDLCPYNEMCQV